MRLTPSSPRLRYGPVTRFPQRAVASARRYRCSAPMIIVGDLIRTRDRIGVRPRQPEDSAPITRGSSIRRRGGTVIVHQRNSTCTRTLRSRRVSATHADRETIARCRYGLDDPVSTTRMRLATRPAELVQDRQVLIEPQDQRYTEGSRFTTVRISWMERGALSARRSLKAWIFVASSVAPVARTDGA